MKPRLGVLAVALAALAGAGPALAAPSPSSAVYVVRGEQVSPVHRVAATPAAALAALLRGPTAAERRRGYTTAIPAGTALRGVALAGGVLTVDLGRRFESGGGSVSMLLRVAQVVHTATQFASVDRVRFRLDGRPVTAIGGEGVIVSPPVGRAAFEGQSPPILVERPLPDDRASTPLVVRGTANVASGRFVVELRAPGGALLARRTVDTDAGRRGSFALRLPFTTTAASLAVVASDRSHRVRVPVSLAPTVQLTRATVDRRAHTVDARLRICFSAGPRAMIVVTERRVLNGQVVASRRWVPQGVKPTRIDPFACRADWRLNWLLAPSLRGSGTYTATIRVIDAYGRSSQPLVIR